MDKVVSEGKELEWIKGELRALSESYPVVGESK
jgi:hypothetical protein